MNSPDHTVMRHDAQDIFKQAFDLAIAVSRYSAPVAGQAAAAIMSRDLFQLEVAAKELRIRMGAASRVSGHYGTPTARTYRAAMWGMEACVHALKGKDARAARRMEAALREAGK